MKNQLENKLVKDMTKEELMEALNLIARDGNDKAMFAKPVIKKEETEEVRKITIEQSGCVATIETSVNDDIEVEVYEETDAEFGRRVRFNIKVEEFRNRQSLRELEEAKKPKFIRKFNEFKTELNRVSNKAFDEFIDRLGR